MRLESIILFIRRTAALAAIIVLGLSPAIVRAANLTALTETLPPLNYEVDGKVTGFSSELLDLMAEDAGLTINKQLLPWARAYRSVQSNKNTLIYSMVRNVERESLFQWVGPISQRRVFLYKHRDRDDISLKTIDDARAYRIGTNNESAATMSLLKQGFMISNNRSTPGLKIAVDDETNMRKFIAKRFDLLVSVDWAAAYNTKNSGLNPNDIQPALLLDDSFEYWYGINLSTDPEVVRKLDLALQRIKKDGRYLKLQQKYLPRTPR
ncbi:MAG: transporter substrate-binding domain-containing protein [Betaproteobacteria bacterium]